MLQSERIREVAGDTIGRLIGRGRNSGRGRFWYGPLTKYGS
jgi:hypothetical protein